MDLNAITSPTLLLNEQKCRSNIRRMAKKATTFNLRFKPHFKTHQSAEIASWFKEEGVDAITVSSLNMASYFASNGWQDITVAFPVNVRAINQINLLGSEVKLSLLVNEMESLQFLQKKVSTNIHIYIEIDTGDNRTGVSPLNIELIEKLSRFILNDSNMKFAGFYSHPGHSYDCNNEVQIKKVHRSVLGKISSLKNAFSLRDDSYSFCIGDTPCSSVADTFDGVDEMSPGNFVFYDLMQAQIGSCQQEDIAIALASPVVAKFKYRNEIVVHGGAIHLSKDYITQNNVKHFGLPVFLDSSGLSKHTNNSYVKSLSQEHGIISCSNNFFNQVSIGDLIGILPVHSCLTANLMKSFLTLDGQNIKQLY